MPPQKVEDDPPDQVSKANHQTTNCSRDRYSNDFMSVVSSSSTKKKKHPWMHVNYPPATSLITAIHTRPRTDIHDIPTLYYSSDEIKRFKQQYKNQFIVRCCEQQQQRTLTAGEIRADQFIRYDSCLSLTAHHPPTTGRQRQQSKQSQHDNTFWRTKVHRQWQSSSSSSASKTKIRNDINNSNIENNGTATVEEESYSYGDLVNYQVPVDRIVFGMPEASSLTRAATTGNEAAKGASSSYSSPLSLVSKKKCHLTSLQLVDNLYLF